jgi:hydrogenase accessory protein HypB
VQPASVRADIPQIQLDASRKPSFAYHLCLIRLPYRDRTAKVLILSVIEGEDKPIKYPHMFQACSLLLLNKIDLLPHLRFDVDRCISYAKRVNPEMQILQVSAQSGEGMEAWYGWLRKRTTSRSE